jgi:hypothetical protein
MPTGSVTPAGGGGGVTPPVTLTGTAPATVPLTIQGAVAQSNDFLDIQDSDENAVVVVGADGSTSLHSFTPTVNHLFRVRSSGNTAAIDVQGDGSGGVDTTVLTATTIDLEAGVTLFLGNAGTLVAAPAGITLRNNAPPADAALSAGDCWLWFDDTNGASALNVKAKQANGTVKTATIPVIT